MRCWMLDQKLVFIFLCLTGWVRFILSVVNKYTRLAFPSEEGIDLSYVSTPFFFILSNFCSLAIRYGHILTRMRTDLYFFIISHLENLFVTINSSVDCVVHAYYLPLTLYLSFECSWFYIIFFNQFSSISW